MCTGEGPIAYQESSPDSETTDGNDVPTGEVGIVWMKMGAAEFEYHKAPEKTAENRRGEYFTVGDMGYLNDEGYLFLSDRKNDMIISGGVNIYPAEIEKDLQACPGPAWRPTTPSASAS